MTSSRGIVIAFGLAVALILTATVIGLARDHHDQTATAVPHGGDSEFTIPVPGPAGATAQAAAENALTTMFSWQPVRDVSAGEGLRRARPWLTGNLATAAQAPPATGIREISDWTRWQGAGDVVTASAQSDQITTLPSGGQQVRVTVTQTVLHRAGPPEQYRVMDIDATTEPTPDGWRLAAFTVIASH